MYFLYFKTELKSLKKVIHLMIPNREGWHYIAVKKSALLRGITSISNGDFYSFNYLHSFRKKLETHKKVCENKDFCGVAML